MVLRASEGPGGARAPGDGLRRVEPTGGPGARATGVSGGRFRSAAVPERRAARPGFQVHHAAAALLLLVWPRPPSRPAGRAGPRLRRASSGEPLDRLGGPGLPAASGAEYAFAVLHRSIDGPPRPLDGPAAALVGVAGRTLVGEAIRRTHRPV